MARQRAVRRGTAGFTLIELLVVVMIIGILAAMAIPQYFKVVEKSRTAEARAFISSLRSAQEAYLARNGVYATDINKLDISFGNCNGSGSSCGMKDFTFQTLQALASCPGSSTAIPGWNVAVIRAGPAGKYGNYNVNYDRCTDSYFAGDTTTNSELMQ